MPPGARLRLVPPRGTAALGAPRGTAALGAPRGTAALGAPRGTAALGASVSYARRGTSICQGPHVLAASAHAHPPWPSVLTHTHPPPLPGNPGIHKADVFAFIELHSLHGFCRDKVLQLAAHSWDRALAMLLRYRRAHGSCVMEARVRTHGSAGAPHPHMRVGVRRYTEAVPPADVVAQLSSPDDERRLLGYLHALFLQDVHLGAAFHGRQLSLYGAHAPELLLPFLRGTKLRRLPIVSAWHGRWASR